MTRTMVSPLRWLPALWMVLANAGFLYAVSATESRQQVVAVLCASIMNFGFGLVCGMLALRRD